MSKDNLNHPGIKVHLDHNIMEKKIWFSQNWQEFFFQDIFIFKKMDEITFFSNSFSEIQWGCFAKLFYTKISPEKFNQ